MVANDLAEIKNFYVTVFGFKAVFYDANFYLHLMSENNAIQLGFLVPNHSSQPEFLQPLMVSDGFVISLEVKNAAIAFAEAQKMNLTIAMDLKIEPWGQIHFMIEDPAGFRIDIIEPVMSEPK
jgi:uncharacterized glyoxalase superfamily protein PhnB